MSDKRKLFSHNCPVCGARFTHKDVDDAMKGKAWYILNKHGMSLRGIGKLFDAHPESVKYHINKFERIGKTGLPEFEEFGQEYTKPTQSSKDTK